jgi:hypothetical protein
MMICGLRGGILATDGYLLNKRASLAINGQALGRIVAAYKSKLVFILNTESRQTRPFRDRATAIPGAFRLAIPAAAAVRRAHALAAVFPD